MWNDDGSIVVIQPTSKTDQVGKGIINKIPRGRKGKVGPAEIIRWYLKSQDIPLERFLFSVLRASGQGAVSWWKKAVGYDTIRKQFKNKCVEFKLQCLTFIVVGLEQLQNRQGWEQGERWQRKWEDGRVLRWIYILGQRSLCLKL